MSLSVRDTLLLRRPVADKRVGPMRVRLPPTGSLRRAIETLEGPGAITKLEEEDYFGGGDWTNEAQGIAYLPGRVFIAANRGVRVVVRELCLWGRCLIAFTHDSAEPVLVEFDENGEVRRINISRGTEAFPEGLWHLGDIDTDGRRLYLGMVWPPSLVVLDLSDGTFLGRAGLRDQDSTFGVAVHPWNGLVYSSSGELLIDGVLAVRGFDVQQVLDAWARDRDGAWVDRVDLVQVSIDAALDLWPSGSASFVEDSHQWQGIKISENGHLYLSLGARVRPSGGALPDNVGLVLCYSMLDGRFLGGAHFPYYPNQPQREEVEGVGLQSIAGQGEIHVMLLDNESFTDDDLRLLHFDVEHPGRV